MEYLPLEILQIICTHLFDVDHIHLLMCNSNFYRMHLPFTHKIHLEKFYKHSRKSLFEFPSMRTMPASRKTIKHLQIQSYYAEPLPSRLISLHINKCYAPHMINVPSSLIELHIDDIICDESIFVPPQIQRLTIEKFDCTMLRSSLITLNLTSDHLKHDIFKYLPHLESLYMNQNLIYDISHLTRLTNLNVLSIHKNVTLPASITYLNCTMTHILPAKLEHLHINELRYIHQCEWPVHLKSLTTSHFGSKSIFSFAHALPSSLIELDLRHYKMLGTHPLPRYLHSLNIQHAHLKNIIDQLPITLTSLKLHTCTIFDGLQHLVHLKILSIIQCTSESESYHFPTSLEHLYIANTEIHDFNLKELLHLDDLTSNKIKICHNTWSSSITHLRMHHLNEENLIFPDALTNLYLFSQTYALNTLPPHLQILSLHHYNQVLPCLPSTLRELNLPSYNQALPHLPCTLRKLELGSYNQPFIQAWPQHLRYLKLDDYNHVFTYEFPSSLKTLALENYDQPLKIAWPERLRYLKMCAYNQKIEYGWPKTLKYIELHSFNQTLHYSWPKHTQYIKLSQFNRSFNHSWPKHAQDIILPALKIMPRKLVPIVHSHLPKSFTICDDMYD